MSVTEYPSLVLGTHEELVAAVESWLPKGESIPSVATEVRRDGLRVNLRYKGVDSGVVFALGGIAKVESIHATLDRLFDVLSWRVTRAPNAG